MSTSAALKADGPRSAPLRILMVEDDANDAELLLAHLAQARLGGAQIVHAHTLAEGLELVQSLDVQITLLDLDLPDSQGLYTLERMRAAASGPVIVISGNGHASLVDEALKRRAYDVIPKDELDAATLRRVLRLASLHREAGREQGATESRYRALLESSSEALVLLDAKGRIQYASAAMRRVLGYNSAEILGCSGLSFVRSEDRQAARKAFVGLSAQPGAFATLRARFRHKGGELRVLESSLANRLGDAEVAAIVCSYRDVTQEEEHRERFAATFENSPVGLAHVDLEGRFQLANQRLCAMLGYAPGELIGRAVRELSHREEIDSTAELGEQLRAGVIPQFTTRKRYLRKDGATIWVQLTVSLERDAQGRPMYDIAAFEDVTDAVRAEERLRDSEARLRAIVGAEPECVKLLDAEGRLLEMNPAGLAMIEAESLDVVAGQCVYALIVPAYRQRFKDLTDRVCRGERASLEFEIVGLKGARRWVETHAVPLRDEARGRNLLLGITRDITSRKHAELAAERLRRMYSALSSANEAIFKIKDEQALFRGICELLVEHGGLKLAAVRLVDRATGWLEVAAHAGGSAAYLENARVSVDPERPESRGPAATAAREKCTTVSNDYLADPALAHWHAAAREAGIAAVTSVPLCRNGEVVGLITLYAAETGWFDLELVGLAERMAQNISFALDNADRERERAAVQSALRDSEERFRSLTKLSTDWFWDQDAELRFTSFVGGQSDAKWRADQTQTIGLRRWEIPRLTPLSCSWDEHRAVLEARRPFRGFEYVRVAEDGSRRYVMASGEPVFGADGAFEGYRGTATDISERKRGELALRESEARFRNLVALSSDFHWETDAEHRITVRSEGVRAGTESTVPVTQVIGKRRWELPFVAPDMQVWMAHKAVLDAHLPFQDFELSRPVPDGGARHFSISGEPVFDDQGTFKGYRGVGTDITVRKSALLALELEHAVNRHLAAADSSLAGVQAVIRAICELSEWDHGRFWRVDEDAGVMRFAALWSMEGSGAESLEPGLREVVFLPGQGIAGRVWQSGEPIWVADASNDPRTAKHALWRTPMRGTFMFPVKAAGRALGVLTFASRTIRRPDEHLLVAAGEIGNRIGQFLERKRSEDELRRFRAGMEASGDMILLVDYKTMRYVDVNETACRTLGYTREEMLAMGPHDLLPTSREELQQTYEGFVADPSTIHGMNSVYRCKDGSTIPFESTRRVLHLETGALIVAISRDIRKRLEAEDALRESEERFRGLTQLSSDWYWEQDAELRFVSTAGRDQVRGGLTDAQHVGLRRWELPGTEPLQGGWDAHRAQLAARQPFRDFMLKRTDSDGKAHYLSVSGEPVFDADGTFRGYRGVAKDVTQHTAAAMALRESEERFRSLIELSSDWYWEQDAELRFVSTAGRDQVRGGLTDAQHVGLRRWELPGTEPLQGGWDAHRAQLAARQPFRDFMLKRTGNDGKAHYLSVSGEPVFSADGTFRGYRGVAKDVTHHMGAVMALRESEERLRSSHERFEIVSRATNDVVRDWNLVTDQVWWNENFQKLFGYAPQEIGAHAESWTSRIHPEDAPRIKSQVDAAIRGGAKAWAGEYRFLCEDGSYVDVFDRGLLMHDERGQPVRMIGAMMDISERKHAERQMRVHAERQAAVARYGQFALGRRHLEELYAEAARALRCEGVDATCVLEMFTAQGEFLVRAAQGEGPHAMLGLRARMAADSVWPDILRENTPRIAGKKYLSSRPLDRPWRAWVQTMGSAMYVPVRDDEKPIAMLCVYALEERAFGTEDLRFAEAVGHVLSTALQRQKAEQRLAHLAQFDALTGLPNRTLLQDRLAQTIVQSRRKRWHAGALFVDLDRFKLINDTLGHHLGDALIRQVGERLLECVRPGDTVGRISGDEFAVVLADMARPDDAALVAQKILDALVRPFELGGNEAYISASIGIAAFPEDGEDAETLLKNADIAMYRAKESARNCYRFFTAEMNQRTLAKVQLNTDLRRAIEREEFTLHYQPKVDLGDGQLRGMEALLRWNHPERGMVPPGEFIPALEDSGLILPVGEWVIGEACAQQRRWKSEGLAVVPMAVNLSPKQFRRGDLDRIIVELLARQGLDAETLELEITESCLMEDPEAAVRVMHNLRAAGLRISIDDFGTGYSSLSYLTRLPLSALKIDRSFVRDAGASAEAASIVRAVIDMAQNMRFTVIAEGVETEQQVAFLRKHGCNQAQGYFFGRPNCAEVAGQELARA